MDREAFAVCSETALTDNFRRLLSMAAGARLIAVVKANAYGHGVSFVAKTLAGAGADLFAVARLSEAIALRRIVPRADVLILGSTPPSLAPQLAEHRLIQTVQDLDYAKALSKASREPIRTHLKLDVGMGRFGISISKSDSFEKALLALKQPRLAFEGIFSHLPSADLPDTEETDRERRSFRRFTERLSAAYRPLPRHLLASAGLLRYGGGGDAFVRPGLALYGYPPSDAFSGRGFSPVLRLYAPVLAIRELSKGERIGYGGTFAAPRSMRVALLGIGYGDGLPRALSGAPVRLGGHFCPIVGRICMDLAFCALPDAARVQIGDLALVFGDTERTLLRLAAHARTIPYELLTSLSARLCREVSSRKDLP